MASLRFVRLLSPPLLVLFGACTGATATGFDTNTGIGLGKPCDTQNICRSGLDCSPAGKCEAAGTTKEGDPCSIGAECVTGICGPASPTGAAKCMAATGGVEGAGCAGDADCSKGLRCGFDGTGFFPRCVKEGAGDLTDSCTKSSECLQGLVCTANRCMAAIVPSEIAVKGIPPFIPGPSVWTGAKCDEPVKGDVSALFKIPRAGDAVHDDFYRLPFPNDGARNKATKKVSFASHPHDANAPMGFDAVKLYLDALEDQPFGNYPTVYFRFDGDFDFGSVSVNGDNPQTRIVDLTPGPNFGQRLGINVFVTNGRNRYICPYYVAVRPPRAAPFKPGGTYGVIMKKGVKSCPTREKDGSCSGSTEVKPSGDFTAMLASSAPSDAALKDAYESYQPLRDWVAKEMLSATDLLNATVFTVGDPGAVAARLRTSVRATTAPKADTWVKCNGTNASPCAQADVAEKRACGAPDADFDEYHAVLDMPVFQQGASPYLSSKDGGGIPSTGGPAEPISPARTEKVCAAITIPKGTAPTGGFPLAIYAHGTGGSFRSHAIDGSAKALSKVDLGGGTTVQFAVLGIDQVQHGPRRGSSKMHPNDLFFNFANPQAARFNAQQGAADQHSLVRLAESLSITDGTATIAIDGTKVVFWGHSQGATEGAIFLPYEPSVKGAVLSGQGAGLMEALVTKTNPVNIKDAMWIALSEGGPKAVDLWHPVLSLLQSWADPADPLNYAAMDVRMPGATPATFVPRHLFQPFGKDDTYTPWDVQANFALAAGLAFVGPEVDARDVFKGSSKPLVEGNIVSGTVKTTAAFRQYAPVTGRDGHFVAFDVDQAKGDVAKFLARVVRGEVPKIPE